MRAAVIQTGETVPRLEVVKAPEPIPDACSLLLVAKAAGLNRADLGMRTAGFGHKSSLTLPIAGFEVAGEVTRVGQDVVGFKPGDRVMAMAHGAFAERVVVDYRLALTIPDYLSWEEAAAIPVAFLTAHDALVTNGEMRSGNDVLIQAASSAVGIAAIQVAQAKGATSVIGTSTSPQKLKRLEALGLTHPIDVSVSDFVQRALEITGGKGAEVIIDFLGRGVTAGNLAAASLGGRIISVGRMAGNVDEINLDELARKRLKLIGVTFRTRSLQEHAAVVQSFKEDMFSHLAGLRFKMPIDRVFPLEDIAAAYEYMGSNTQIGKIVVSLATGRSDRCMAP